ncbi:hypothetical protein WA1_04060 [Scytonema hofmannii PCC 7110]|uniref:Uncharacterized protein n=1 Tax=Scytonema hofmannii PCC 7110 TaxID=128403 RepID=A0A139WZA3_9CYAN|nr:COP23 domain-containing protein [Scytonema hofmannii]KYC37702.1 hypothetical protein WA1_04060 [Scytonema hofmannii PCC 7110]
MSKGKHIFEGANLTTGLIGAAAGIASLVLAYIVATGWTPEMSGFSSKDRFSCTLQPDAQNGGEVWMVMYRNDRGTKPWLRMVNSFGGGWNTLKRCNEIAQRLESFRQDGLVGFSHRFDPKTPNQSVICAITKLDRNNCNLLITLKPNVDGYDSLRRMLEAHRNGTTVDQGSNSSTVSTFPPGSTFISFEDQLAKEDLKAGSDAKK